MEIKYDTEFSQNINNIFDFIARDSIHKANNFIQDLENTIIEIPNFPYKHRKSIYYLNKTTRDLIFKGYAIPYLIDEEQNIILILDIIKYRLPKDANTR